MTCLLAGVFASYVWIGVQHQLVTVCPYTCPDPQETTRQVAAILPYGTQCPRELQADPVTYDLIGSAGAPPKRAPTAFTETGRQAPKLPVPSPQPPKGPIIGN